MKTLMHVTGLAFLLCAWPYCCAEVVANAAPTPTGSPKSATEACETAVTDAIQEAALKSTKEMVTQFMDKAILALKEQ